MSKHDRRFVIHDDQVLLHLVDAINQERKQGRAPTVDILDPARTLDQNAMFHAFYRDIATQKPDDTFEDIRRYCKLHFGVPILRRDDPDFRLVWDKGVMHQLDYEEKLQAMAFYPVTSLMKKRQASEFIEEIISHFTENGYPPRPRVRHDYAQWAKGLKEAA